MNAAALIHSCVRVGGDTADLSSLRAHRPRGPTDGHEGARMRSRVGVALLGGAEGLAR